MGRDGGGNKLVVLAAAAVVGLALGIVLMSGRLAGATPNVDEIQAPLTTSTDLDDVID
jgi:hypothetical protein